MPTERIPHILVVDDERTIADSLAMILDKSGYSTSIAYSGKHALEVSRINAPDLLISDVIMPEMNGFQLAVALKTALPHCGVLLISGQATTARLLEVSNSSGVYLEILSKPIPPAEMLAHVERFFLEHPAGPGPAHLPDSNA